MGLTTTAEGIETDVQLADLKADGCVEGQGYLFGKAIPAAQIPELLRLPSIAAEVGLTRAGYQPPPPPPPPPEPPPPPPLKPDEPEETGTALAKALLTLATEDDTALPKSRPDQPPPLLQPGW